MTLNNFGGRRDDFEQFWGSILLCLTKWGEDTIITEKWRAIQPFFTEYLYYLLVHHLFHYFKVLNKVYITDFK